mgnify:CR=1 FL=1
MATQVSSDISTNINITARKNDSFYLEATLTNEDDTVFDLTSYTSVVLEIKKPSGTLVKKITNTGTASSDTTESLKAETITNDTTNGIIKIDVPYSTTVGDSTFTNMNLLVGSYDYTLKISSSTELHTVMHGRFKIID